MPVKVVTDSASYLPEDLIRRFGIEVVSLNLVGGGESIPETSVDSAVFFEQLSLGGGLPTTSQPDPESFESVFSKIVAQGDDVLAVLISGGMSGTVMSAEVAASSVADESTGPRIRVVDSRANCMQEGFAVLAAAEAASRGATLEECERAARESMHRSRFLFAPETLEYLRRGGRISAAAALVGSALKVVPILTAENGQTGVAGRARTQSRALQNMARIMRDDVERCGLRQVVVQTIGDSRPGVEFAHTHVEPLAGRPVQVLPIGPVIGLHVGPAIGLTYETIEPLN